MACGCLLTQDGAGIKCPCLSSFYSRLLNENQKPVFREGKWSVVHEHVSEHGLICWLWSLDHEQVLVVINYSETEAVFSLKDQLHLLHLKNPVEIMNEDTPAKPHRIRSLAPWSVYAWEVENM